MIRLLPLLLICSFCVIAHDQDSSIFISLEHAQARAIQNFQELQIIRNQYSQGVLNRKIAESQWFPLVKLSAELRRSEPLGVGGYRTQYGSQAHVTQQLFSQEKYRAIGVADSLTHSLEYDVAEQLNQTLLGVRTRYYEVVLNCELVKVEKQNLTLLKEALDREEHRFSVGEATSFEVNQAKVAYVSAFSSYWEAVKKWRISQSQWILSMGEKPEKAGLLQVKEQTIRLDRFPLIINKLEEGEIKKEFSLSPLEELKFPSALFSDQEIREWQNLAIKKRPSLKSLKWQVDAKKKGLEQAQGKYYPEVSAFATFSQKKQSTLPASYWETGLQLDWTLFDGLSRERTIQKARKSVRITQLQEQRLLHEVVTGIKDRFFELEKEFYSLFAAIESAKLAEEALRLARSRREVGAITPLDFRDVTQALTRARFGLTQARYQLLATYFSLLQQVGIAQEEENVLQ